MPRVKFECPNAEDPKCKKIFYRYSSDVAVEVPSCSHYCSTKMQMSDPENRRKDGESKLGNQNGVKHGLYNHQSYFRWHSPKENLAKREWNRRMI